MEEKQKARIKRLIRNVGLIAARVAASEPGWDDDYNWTVVEQDLSDCQSLLLSSEEALAPGANDDLANPHLDRERKLA